MKFRSVNDRLVFYVCISTMVGAGITFERALKSLLDKAEENNNNRGFFAKFLPVDFRPDHQSSEVLAFLYEKLRTGHKISDAVRATGTAFPRYVAGTIKAAEESGELDTALLMLAETEEKENQLRQKLKKAIRYPLIVGALGFSLVWGLALFLGDLRSIFEELDTPMNPMLATALDVANGFFHPLVILSLLFLLYLGYRKLSQPKFQRKLRDISRGWVPVFSRVMVLTANIQFCRLLGMQLKAGCSLLPALTRALEGTDDQILIYHANVKEPGTIMSKLVNGLELSKALDQSGYFSAHLISMLKVAEEQGSLDKALFATADFLQEEMDYRLQAFATIVEPVFIAITGICVGLVAIGTFMPLLQVMNF